MRRLLILGLLLVAGCLRDDDPFDVDTTPLQVHAVLQARSSAVTVLVSTPDADRNTYIAVSGAVVNLTSSGETVRLYERTDGIACAAAGRTPIGSGAGCYSAELPRPVSPGFDYALSVDVPGHAPVTGVTRVPQSVDFVPPIFERWSYTIPCPPPEVSTVCVRQPGPDGDAQPLNVIELVWNAPPGAAYVDAQLQSVGVVRENAEYEGTACLVEPNMLLNPEPAPRERLRWPIHTITCEEPLDQTGWDTIHMVATVAVYDSAYAQYMDAVLDRDAARLESVSAGLHGAVGVFGSVNATDRDLVLIRVSDG